MKTVLKQMAFVSCAAMMVALFLPVAARADATASSSLTFSGITVTPGGGGTFSLVTNWSGEAYAQATLTSQDHTGISPTANATGDFSTVSASVNAGTPGGSSSANGSIIGVDGSDNATGQGTVTSWFIISGGSGNVDVTFGASISGSWNVLTDANGQLAQAETIFALDVSGTSALFHDQFNSIGPSDSSSGAFSIPLSGLLTLQYDTPYMLLAQGDSEISVVNAVPEPSAAGLLGAGAMALAWFGRKQLRRRMKMVSSVGLVFGLCGMAQATYVGADAPDVCQTCGVTPTRLPGGTASDSLTEGNLREDYPVTTLHSGGGPSLQLSLAYNSYNADGSKAQIDSGLGVGWTHSYNMYLFQQRGSFFQMGPDGRVTMYHFSFFGGWTADAGYFETITPQTDGSYIVADKFGNTRRFAYVPGTQLLVGGTVYRLTQTTDRNGNVTTLNYTGGQLTQIIDTYGRTVTLSYTNSHLASVTDPLGQTTQFQYDSKFRTPVRIIDPNGRSTRYTYNSQYQMTKKFDRDGRTYFYLYRNLKPWAVVDGSGQTWFLLQNTNNWAVDRNNLAQNLRRTYLPATSTGTDGRGNVWRYQYDANGYITRVTAPDGATTSYGYDSQTQKLRAVTNADGEITRYQYDSRGNRTNITAGLTASGGDQSPITTTYTYEPIYNQVMSVTDPSGRNTTYQYDAHGNRTNETDPLLNHRTWTYDSHGNMLTETDKNGHTTTYSYNAMGGLTNVVDALGHASHYTRDFAGQPTMYADQLGRVTTYTYQYGVGDGELTSRTDPQGGTTRYGYDGAGRMTTNIDALGRSTTYFYDVRGRLLSTTDPAGNTESYGYDENNNRVAATNRLGNVTTYQYDPQNRMTTETDPLGGVATNGYDGVGNRTSSMDRNGNTTHYKYDSLDRRTDLIDPLGHTTHYDYSTVGGPPCCSPTIGSGLITRMADADGHVTFYKYDELDRLKETVKKQGDTNDTITTFDAVTTYAYDPVGNRLAVTDPVGNTNIYAYDALNRMVAATNAAGDVRTSAYDPAGNVIRQTSPSGNITTNTYDALNRVISVYDGIGRVTTNAYDAVGNQVSATDANGNITTSVYDSLDRRTDVTDALGRVTMTGYDAVGNMVTNIDRNGYVTRYEYDANNRRTSQVDALGNTSSYGYDANGNVTTNMDANGHVTTYSYDGLNRRVTEVYADAPPNTVTFSYDAVGNVISRTDQLGRVTTYQYSDLYYRTNRSYSPSGVSEHFTYDLSGRVLTADRGGWVDTFGYDGASRLVYTTQNGQILSYIYDIAGRRQTNAYPSGRVIQHTYDGRNRLLTKQEGINPPMVTYTYDAADRVITRNYRNGATTTYGYDADNRVTSLEHSNSVGRVAGFGYDYDFEGNRLDESKRHAPGDSEAFQYDGMNRLTDYRVGALSGVTIPSPGIEKVWNLDPLGNWINVASNLVVETRTHGPANELLTVDAQTYTYDADGNLVQDSGYSYTYDEENRLTQVERLSDSAVVGRYYYDAMGRRVVAITHPAGTVTTNVYYYDETRVVEEQNGGGVPQATYVYGNYADELLTMDRGGQTYYYHQNVVWSPHALTDSTGAVIERYTYDAHGGVIVLDAGYSGRPLNSWGTPHSTVGNPYLFTGRELDEEAGLYFYRARYYDCVKGRFLQRDPAGYVDGLNLYRAYFVPNSTDPSGLVTYRLVSRGSYGATSAGFVRPSCSCPAPPAPQTWTLNPGSANPTVTVNPTGTYRVRGDDGNMYTATCTRLAAGLKATRDHEDSHAAGARAGVAKANTDAGLPMRYATQKACEDALAALLPDWNKTVNDAWNNEVTHGPGTIQPTAATFDAENAAGKCAFVKDP